MSNPAALLIEAMTATASANDKLDDIFRAGKHSVPVPADRFTEARILISRALCATTALEQLAKGNPEPATSH